MSNPVFAHYEQSLIAEAVEKQYGPVGFLSEESLAEKYFTIQLTVLDNLLISNIAAESLNSWLKTNTSMSMEQAILVSEQIDLIQTLSDSCYSFDLVTTENHSGEKRISLVTERFNLTVAVAVITTIGIILEIIKYFSGPKSPNSIIIVKTEKKVQSLVSNIPKTVNDVPKASKTCNEKNGTAFSVSSEIIRRGSNGELETGKNISATEILSFF